VKSGLCVLEKWIVEAEEEHTGTSWDELKFIRQAVDFLVKFCIHFMISRLWHVFKLSFSHTSTWNADHST